MSFVNICSVGCGSYVRSKKALTLAGWREEREEVMSSLAEGENEGKAKGRGCVFPLFPFSGNHFPSSAQ